MSELAGKGLQENIPKLMRLLASNLVAKFVINEHNINTVATCPEFLVSHIWVRKGMLQIVFPEYCALAAREESETFDPS